MKNYALEWKKNVNLRNLSYEDFVSKFHNISNIFYLEKIDGMLGALIYREGRKPFFQLSSGRVISDLPVLYEYGIYLKKLKIKEAILIGELVAQKFATVLPFNQTSSIVRTAYKRPEYKDLVHHYLVDVYSLNKKKLAFKQTFNFISKNFGKIGFPHIHTPKIAYGGMDAFRKLYESTKNKPGFDGVVARDIDGNNYRVKFTGTVDLAVIGGGNIDMKAWEKKQIPYLLTAFIDKDKLFRTSSKVGTGFTTKQRETWFRFVNENKIYEKDGDFFVKPGAIVQVKYFRYRITPTITYKFVKGKYETIGNKESVTLSHPTFERMRYDKKANKYDVRLEQIPSWKG